MYSSPVYGSGRTGPDYVEYWPNVATPPPLIAKTLLSSAEKTTNTMHGIFQFYVCRPRPNATGKSNKYRYFSTTYYVPDWVPHSDIPTHVHTVQPYETVLLYIPLPVAAFRSTRSVALAGWVLPSLLTYVPWSLESRGCVHTVYERKSPLALPRYIVFSIALCRLDCEVSGRDLYC